MSSFVVSDTNQLLAALKAATAGDEIRLKAGEYAPFVLQAFNVGGNVKITSDDPNNQATLTGFRVSNAKDLTFTDLRLHAKPTAGDNPFQVSGSSNVTLNSLHVHGSLNQDTSDDVAAFLIRNNRGITVSNSKFEQLKFALGHLDNDGLVIEGNSFTDIRSDGIRGGGSSNVLVKNNFFRDFYPIGADHPDAIQFWTTNTTKTAVNITVEGNVILRGAGSAMQGIFFGDEAKIPYENVKIVDNFMFGAGYNAIALSAKNSVISGNHVLVPPGEKAWIRLAEGHQVTMSDNKTYLYSVPGWNLPADRSAISYDSGLTELKAWLASADLASFPDAMYAVPGMEALRPSADAPPPLAQAPAPEEQETVEVEVCAVPQGDTEWGASSSTVVSAAPSTPAAPSGQPAGPAPSTPAPLTPALLPTHSEDAVTARDGETAATWSAATGHFGVQARFLWMSRTLLESRAEDGGLGPKSISESSALAVPSVTSRPAAFTTTEAIAAPETVAPERPQYESSHPGPSYFDIHLAAAADLPVNASAEAAISGAEASHSAATFEFTLIGAGFDSVLF